MEKTVAVYSLGCKVNQYESEAVLEQFAENGFSCVNFNEYSDVYIINTCTVTGIGDRKSRQVIRRAKVINPDAVLVVMGCYAQTAADEILSIPEVDIVFGTGGRSKIYDEVMSFIENRERKNLVSDIFNENCFEELKINNFEHKARAFMKVQDGCNRYCSYCIIPYARGKIRSRDIDNCIEEAKKISENGFSEIVLVGIHLASYGKENGGATLYELIESICKVEGIERVRLGSLEPTIFTDDFIDKICMQKKVCRHFHISMQSGCDETLLRMNRRYTAEEYFHAVSRIREKIPNCAITTDILTGFPGETDEEFNTTYEFVKKVNFSDAHVFKYSPRKGTKAAVMENQVPSQVKEERSKKLISLVNECRISYLNDMVGKTVEVLFEEVHKKKEGFIEGKTDTYVSVCAPGNSENIGKFKKVKIKRSEGALLVGEIV